MVQLSQPVEAPQLRPPKYGLLVAAPTIDDPAFRFAGRFAFLPERCGDGGRLAVECEGNTGMMTLTTTPTQVDGESFVVWGGDKCSTLGFRALDLVARAQRVINAVQSYEIAAELWGGSLNLLQRSLADPSADTLTEQNGPVIPEDALACIEQGIAYYGHGQQGMVHVTPQMLVYLVTNNSIYRDGGLWVTPMGNIVVADAGYDGSGPNGEPAVASQWMYGTSIISVRLGAIDTIPDNESQAVTRSVNDIEYWAYRPVAYQWDECVHVAAQVDIAPCLVGGVS